MMNEEIFNEIKTILVEKATLSKVCTISLLINTYKEKEISKAQVNEAIEKLQRNGDTYIIPKSICLID